MGTKVRLFFEWENFCGFLRGGNFPHFPQVPHFPQHVFVRKRGREGEQLWIDMMMEKGVRRVNGDFWRGGMSGLLQRSFSDKISTNIYASENPLTRG
jgi:hypothetical protein